MTDPLVPHDQKRSGAVRSNGHSIDPTGNRRARRTFKAETKKTDARPDDGITFEEARADDARRLAALVPDKQAIVAAFRSALVTVHALGLPRRPAAEQMIAAYEGGADPDPDVLLLMKRSLLYAATEDLAMRRVPGTAAPATVRAFYDSPAWRRVRAQYRARHPRCEACETRGRIVPAAHVHHRVKVADNPSLGLRWSNLMAVCAPCHNRLDKGGRAGCGPDGLPTDPAHPWRSCCAA